jgi:hypothetical protein
MKEKYIQILGIILSITYAFFIVWLYAYQPKTIQEAATKATVAVGTYEIDKAKFDQGLQSFRQDNFVVARDAFLKSDPEKRDANIQFYIAYSFYRQGFGKVSNDDALFKQGLESVNYMMNLNPNYKATDENLKMKTPAELKNELEEGLKITADDFNPLKVFRERK